LTILNKTFIRIFKKVVPWFVHGLNNDGLEHFVSNTLPVIGCSTFDTDGGSHDSNQHPELIKCVDNYIITSLKNDIINANTEIPSDILG
jgi:hypothetical protein